MSLSNILFHPSLSFGRSMVGEFGGRRSGAMALSFLASGGNLETMSYRMLMALATFLVVANAQPTSALDYNCSGSFKNLEPFLEDPCANSTAYSQLGSCGDFINGNVTTPSAACCASSLNVWTKIPACFCKVTFLSIFSDPGPARALERPALCNITDDLCTICPRYLDALTHSEKGDGNPRKLNTASVVTISVIVTLAIAGSAFLVYRTLRKRALAKQNQSNQSKPYVPQFNNV